MKLTLNSLTKTFGTAKVLDDISADIDCKRLALIGPSGSGKSTLLKIMGGLLLQDAGDLSIDGSVCPIDEQSRILWRKNLGYVFQNAALFSHVSAKDGVVLPLVKVHGYSEEEADSRVDELFLRFGLKEAKDKYPHELSGGQKQRVAIIRAIAHKPKLLLLDEPTSALDPEYTSEVLDVINELAAAGINFVIVTHEMGFAKSACDYVAFLKDGKIQEAGPSKELFDAAKTEDLKNFLAKLLAWEI